MTELAIQEEPAPTPSQSTLAVWAEGARQAAGIAVSLAKTPFVPQSLRDRDAGVTAANITAAILTGQELGLEPMAALRSIDIIQGTPAVRAVALRALVLSAGHDIWLEESTQTRAIVRGRRKGSDHVQESVWTVERARSLSLLGKDNWKKQQGAMLIARATSECARLVAPDALLGVPYTVEELDDDSATTIETPAPTTLASRRRTLQRKQAEPVETPEPALEPDLVEPSDEVLAAIEAESAPELEIEPDSELFK